jgi:ATP-dependent Clp protease protease subunit
MLSTCYYLLNIDPITKKEIWVNNSKTKVLILAGLTVTALVAFTGASVILNKKMVEKERLIEDIPYFKPAASVSPENLDTANLKRIKDIELTDENTVELIGQVSLSTIKKAVKEIKGLQNKGTEDELFLLITSPGGSVFAGAMLMETVQHSPIPVNTVCVAFCASMGAQIHQMGKRRMMTDKSVLMFHPASGGVEGEMETVGSRVNFILNFVNKMDAFIAQRAGINVTEFKAKLRNELWLDSRDATNSRFNDDIVYLVDKRSDIVRLPGLFGDSNDKKKETLGEDKFFNLK